MEVRVARRQEREIAWTWLRGVAVASDQVTLPRRRAPVKSYLAIDDGSIVGAIATEVTAGRLAHVWPPWLPHRSHSVGRALFSHLHNAIRPEVDLCLLSWPLTNRAPAEPTRLLQEAGYERFAEMEHLVGQVDTPTPFRNSPHRTIESVPQHDPRLADVIAETERESLNSPTLHDPRPYSEVIRTLTRTIGGKGEPPTYQCLTLAGDRPIGCLVLHCNGFNTTAEVRYLGVIPTFRGRGEGGRLLAWARHIAQQWHCDSIALHVDRANTPAVTCYARNHLYPVAASAMYGLALGHKATQ